MAIFSSNKKEDKGNEKKDTTKKVVKASVTDTEKKAEKVEKTKKAGDKKAKLIGNADGSYELLLLRPLITEKAALITANSTYVFEIPMRATKHDVATAMHEHYNVTPVKINIVRMAPRKKVSRARNRVGIQRGSKKAYVYLKKGEHIEIA